METNSKSGFAWHVDWRWVVVSYCYLVLFHLLPTFLLGGFVIGRVPMDITVQVRLFNPASLWLLPGLAIVAFVVGYRSRGFTVLEPAIAGFLYAVTTTIGFGHVASTMIRGREAMAAVFWLLIVIILTVASAWIGEVVQRRRDMINVK